MTDWISVDDRLPDKTGTYLIAYTSYMTPEISVRTAYYTSGGGWELPTIIDHPIHWMPLPEPPEVDDDR